MAAAKANVYEMVTTRIIEELEKGIIPWEKPWTGIRAGAYNRVSKKPYSMINQMLLKHTGEYATFKQWQDLGGHVKKGEKCLITSCRMVSRSFSAKHHTQSIGLFLTKVICFLHMQVNSEY